MQQIYIGIGSNVNPSYHINCGLTALEQQFCQLVVSSVFETEPVDSSGNNFYNLVVACLTDDEPQQVVVKLKQIEQQNGRNRHSAQKTLDLDLLCYGQQVQKQPFTLPHHEITKYAFVLKPLAEIAPTAKLPGTEQTYQQLWQQFDQHNQRLWRVPFNRT